MEELGLTCGSNTSPRDEGKEAGVRKVRASTVMRAGQVAVLVSRKAALHCLRVARARGRRIVAGSTTGVQTSESTG
jgi:hypothetical protein